MADHGSPSRSAETPNPLPQRGRVAGRGFVERVTIMPRNDAPRFSATIALHTERSATGSDAARGASRVRLVWTGQRRIPGIDPGIELAFEGMVSLIDGTPTIHNPRYEIVGRPEESP